MKPIQDKQSEHRLLSIALRKPDVVDTERFSDLFQGAERDLASCLVSFRTTGKPFDPHLMTGFGTGDDPDAVAVLAAKLKGVAPPIESTPHLIEKLRKVLVRNIGIKLTKDAFTQFIENEEPENTVNLLQSGALDLTVNNLTNHFDNPENDFAKILETLEWRMENPGKVRGMPLSIWPQMNQFLDGIHPEYIIIGARPSVGKTALLTQILDGLPCRSLLFSLEMSSTSIRSRLVEQRSGVSLRPQNGMSPCHADLKRINDAVVELQNERPKRIQIDDRQGLTIDRMEATIRKANKAGDIGCVAVDYIQLMTGGKTYRGDRRMEVSEISNGLKRISREHKIPVIALAQLNRGMSQYSRSKQSVDAPKPTLEDLKETGSLEQDADTVLLLSRELGREDMEIAIAKQRNGPAGISINFDFNGASKIAKEKQ